MRIGPDNYRSVMYLSSIERLMARSKILEMEIFEHLTEDYRFLLRFLLRGIRFSHWLVECDIEFNVYFNLQISVCLPDKKTERVTIKL